MKTRKRALAVCLSVFVTSLIACVPLGPTQPNPVYKGPWPSCFKDIETQNPLLFEEIGRLPEIQDGIGEDDKAALLILSRVYSNAPRAFDRVFSQMLELGIPSVRKYNSPLQALFWLAGDSNQQAVTHIIHNYSLNALLNRAWHFGPAVLTDREIQRLTDSISDPQLKQQYLRDAKKYSNQQLQNFLLVDYRLDKSVFPESSQQLLEQKKSSKNPRWSDFQTVVERLNAPELLDYYQRDQQQWVDWRTLPTWPVSIQYVFENRKGDCTGIAEFAEYCLTRAGYQAYELKVEPRRPVDNHHSICVFRVDGVKYVMDNGSPVPKGIVLYEDY